MTKALNEAKLNTSWIQPNEEWLAASQDFVAKILEPSTKNKFLPTFLPVAQEVARLGAVNALAQALLKLTSPGVPSIYRHILIIDGRDIARRYKVRARLRAYSVRPGTST